LDEQIMADATNAGNVYVSIRADIKRLSKDLADAEKAAKQGAEKIQASIDKGMDFERMKVAAVGAAAGIYSAFRTIGQAMESAKVGATLIKQAEAFDNLASAAGRSSRVMIDSLKVASRGMVAEQDLMAASGKALLMNIPADKISELMTIAAATSRMTGQTITQAFDDITLGVARQSRMILDNLGIIVDVDAANEKYAASLGKTATALSEAEKKQAFMNAVLSAGSDMIRRLGDSQASMDGVAKATAQWTEMLANLNKEIAEKSNPLFEAIAGVLKRINLEFQASAEAAKAYGESIETIDARIAELNKRHGDMQNRKEWGYNEAPDVEYRRLLARKSELGLQGTSDSGRGRVPGRYGFTFEPKYFGSKRVGDNEVMYDPSKFDDYIKALEEKSKAEQKAAEEEAAALKKSQDEVEKYVASMQKAAMELNKIEDVNSEARFVNAQRLTEAIQGADFEDEQRKNIEKILQDWEDSNQKVIDLSQHTAEAVQDAWADIFFDAMTGKLKTLEDYFQAFYQAIARMASQYLSQSLMTSLTGEGGGLSQLSGFFGSFGGGGNGTMDMTTAAALVRHGGGITGGGMRSIPASYYSSAPRLHSGLMPDEYPAILQKGEAVIPKGGSMGGGGDTYYYISAMDSQSIVDSLRRSGAVPMLAEENIRNNGGLRKTIQTRAR
jgi:DNA-binding phage protein/predicted transcriptional regulator